MNAVAPNNDRLHELLADRATQGLSAEERHELESLGGLEETSYDWTATAVDLPTVLVDLEPMPASVRDRVDVAAVGWLARSKGLTIAGDHGDESMNQQERDVPALAPIVVGSGKAGLGGGWLPWLTAAAAIAVAVIGWWPESAPELLPLVVQRETLMAEAGTTLVAWTDPAKLGVTGDVVWNNRTNQGFLRFKGLGANDPSRMQYQLWIFDAARQAYSGDVAVDGGVFDIAQPGGEVIVPINAKLDVKKPFLFAITTEPPGGVVKHATDEEKGYRIILTADPTA